MRLFPKVESTSHRNQQKFLKPSAPPKESKEGNSLPSNNPSSSKSSSQNLVEQYPAIPLPRR